MRSPETGSDESCTACQRRVPGAEERKQTMFSRNAEGFVCTSLAVRVVVAHTPSRDFRLDSHTKGKTKEKETAVYTTLSKT